MLVKEETRLPLFFGTITQARKKIYDFSSLIIPVCKKSAMICSTR